MVRRIHKNVNVLKCVKSAPVTEAVRSFIERFASILVDGGVPRMPARVFAALLATDSGRLNAAELAGVLQVSPAAVSGAVRYLTQVGLVSREREPGSRRDVYRVSDDLWYESIVNREPLLRRWQQALAEGVEALGADSAAGRRLADSVEFFAFLQEELPDLLARWRRRRTN
jgi:DNA-binding transcriptional regulator GbsR (MarR family)